MLESLPSCAALECSTESIPPPLCIDLYCGLGGWAEGFLAEGYRVIGFDIERHDYGTGAVYPGQLVLQDVTTLHGSQFKDAAVIVASPPCQEFSYHWRFRAKAPDPSVGIELFRACLRIREESGVPMVIENVIGAQAWVGRSLAHWGAYYLWGDVPALLPHRNKGDGIKGDADGLPSRFVSSKSLARKRMTAEIAKIPFPLARHIAQVFKP